MTPQEQEALLAKVGGETATALKNAFVERDSKITELETKSEKLDAVLREQGETITALKNAKVEPKDFSIAGQIKEWQDKNKENLEKLKAGQNVSLEPLQLKVAVNMMRSTTALDPVAYYAQQGAEINDLVRPQPTFWNRLRKGRTNLAAYPWINKTNKQGNAQFIAEGALKPLASFDLTTELSVPKKVAERMKMSTEILYDIPSFARLVEDELRFEVETAANAAVLTGVGSATSPAGITTLASLYTLTGIQTKSPTYADAVLAAITQLRVLGYDTGIAVFVNPTDYANMLMEKASTSGVYMSPPYAADSYATISGIPVIQDSGITKGKVLVADMSKYRVEIYQDFHVAFGWMDDDFGRNMVTAIGEMRFHQYSSANNATAYIFDTFANIKTAITAP